MLAGSPEKSELILEEARELFSRVKTEAEDPNLGKEALQMEAYCLLILKRPEEILELLGEDAIITNPAEPVLASAYKLLGYGWIIPGMWQRPAKILRSSAIVCLLKRLICFCEFCCLLQLSVSIYIKMDKKSMIFLCKIWKLKIVLQNIQDMP